MSMDEMMSYIFGDLRTTKNALKYIDRTLRRQKATNRRLALLILATATYAVVAEFCHQEQRKRIEELDAEIEELRKKGE